MDQKLENEAWRRSRSPRMTTHKRCLRSLAVVATLVLAGCGQQGLSRSEVEAIAQEAAADAGSGVSLSDIDEAVEAAMAGLSLPEGGLSRSELEEAVAAVLARRGDSAVSGEHDQPGAVGLEPPPSKSDPSAYTQWVVSSAISRYQAEGRGAAVSFYNLEESVDGQWYVFIIDENDEVMAHYDPGRLGLDVNDWVGTDVNGYRFGPELLSADEQGKWVSYVYRNPDSGRIGDGSTTDFELKNAWVVRHDGLLFASGWYINIDEFITTLVDEIAERLGSTGLDATIDHFNEPQNLTVGLRGAVDYYNSTATADGTWVGYYADPDGTVLFHNDPAAIGSNIADFLGPAVLVASSDPVWVTQDDNPDGLGPSSMRIRATNQDGIIFGAGWYQFDG